MTHSLSIVVNSHNSLESKELHVTDPKAYEVQVKSTAISVNMLDIHHTNGAIKLHDINKIPGVCAVGIIQKVGTGVKGFASGDKVVYISQSGGGYTHIRNIEFNKIVKATDKMSDTEIAGSFFKAITAHMLVCRAYRIAKGAGILINGASGGVGGLVAQWANIGGAYVIGTVSGDDKIQDAISMGCHKVVNYNQPNWAKEVREITKNYGVNAVYDAIGKQTFLECLECLMDVGIMVQYGNLTGMVSGIDLSILYSRALFFTRPSVFFYKAKHMELILTAQEVFDRLTNKELVVQDPITFPLIEASKAHQLVASRTTKQPIVLIP